MDGGGGRAVARNRSTSKYPDEMEKADYMVLQFLEKKEFQHACCRRANDGPNRVTTCYSTCLRICRRARGDLKKNRGRKGYQCLTMLLRNGVMGREQSNDTPRGAVGQVSKREIRCERASHRETMTFDRFRELFWRLHTTLPKPQKNRAPLTLPSPLLADGLLIGNAMHKGGGGSTYGRAAEHY